MSRAVERPLRICVFCAAATGISARYLDLAAQVGAEIARRGHTLVSGGGSVSSMGALARAARAAGGRTIGVIPQALVDAEVADTAAAELHVTPDMSTRKARMMHQSDAFLTLAGGLGTLDELLEVWTTRALRQHGKPVVVLDPDGVFAPLRGFAERLCAQGFATSAAIEVVTWETSVAGALEAIERASAAGIDQASPRRVQDGARVPRIDSTISSA